MNRNIKNIFLAVSMVSLFGSPTAVKANWQTIIKHPATLITIGATVGFYVRHACETSQAKSVLAACNNWFWSKLGYDTVQPQASIQPNELNHVSSEIQQAPVALRRSLSRANSERFNRKLVALQELAAALTEEIPRDLRLPRTPPSSSPAATLTTSTASTALTLLDNENSLGSIRRKHIARKQFRQNMNQTIRITNELGGKIITKAFELFDNADASLDDLLAHIPEKDKTLIGNHLRNIAMQTKNIERLFTNIESLEATNTQNSTILDLEIDIDTSLTNSMSYFAKLVKYVNETYKKTERS